MTKQSKSSTTPKRSLKKVDRPEVKEKIDKKINLTDEVMRLIDTGQIEMKPRWYFVLGSSLTVAGLTIFFVLAVFFFNHFFFHLTNTGVVDFWSMPGFSRVFWQMFPWWSLPVALLFLALGLWLVYQYDIAYKKSYKFIVLILFLSAVAFGFGLNFLGINHVLIKQRRLSRIYYKRQLGQDWLIGKVVKIIPQDRKLLVLVGNELVTVYYSNSTRMPRRRILPGSWIKAIGRLITNQHVFKADAIGFSRFSH